MYATALPGCLVSDLSVLPVHYGGHGSHIRRGAVVAYILPTICCDENVYVLYAKHKLQYQMLGSQNIYTVFSHSIAGYPIASRVS